MKNNFLKLIFVAFCTLISNYSVAQESGTLGISIEMDKEVGLPSIGGFTSDSTAKAAGVPLYGLIWSINGTRVKSPDDVILAIYAHNNLNKPVHLEVGKRGSWGFKDFYVLLKPPPSRIELKLIQTRRFNKSVREVNEAIIGLNKDQNIRCQLIFSIKCGLVEYETSEMQIRGNDTSALPATEVRIRIRNKFDRQIYSIENYQALFKELADGLFVDSIQLNPAQMQ